MRGFIHALSYLLKPTQPVTKSFNYLMSLIKWSVSQISWHIISANETLQRYLSFTFSLLRWAHI